MRIVDESLVEHARSDTAGTSEVPAGSLEEVLDGSADAFRNLGGAFHSAHPRVFTRSRSAFTYRCCRVDGMQSRQIGRALAYTFRSTSSASGRASRHIAGAVRNLPSRTRLPLLVLGRLVLCLGGRSLTVA